MRGSSMEPFIWSGATVRVVHSDTVARGDVVLAKRGEALYCHRVVGRSPRGVTLQGDAHGHSDGDVREDAVLGRVDGLVLGKWSFAQVPLPVARWVRSRLVLPMLPLTRATRRGVLAASGWIATGLDKVGPIRSALQRRMDVTAVPSSDSGLSAALISWGRRPDEAELSRWKGRVSEDSGFALAARFGNKTCLVLGIDETTSADGRRVGIVADVHVRGRLFAAVAAMPTVETLVRTAREKGLKTLRVSARVAGPVERAFVAHGFRSVGEALAIAL